MNHVRLTLGTDVTKLQPGLLYENFFLKFTLCASSDASRLTSYLPNWYSKIEAPHQQCLWL